MKKFWPLLTLISVLLLSESGRAQEIGFTAGAEVPELINLGVRVRFDQLQVGFTVGTFPESGQDIFTVSGDFYSHFGGSSEFTDLRPWYIKTGITYLSIEDQWSRDSYFMLVPQAGKELNISEKFAIALEGGLLVTLTHDSSEGDPTWFNFSGSVWPSGGINLIYRY